MAHMTPIHRSNKMEIKIHISKIHNLCLPNYTYVLHHSYHYSYCTLETKCCTLDDSKFHIVGKEAWNIQEKLKHFPWLRKRL